MAGYMHYVVVLLLVLMASPFHLLLLLFLLLLPYHLAELLLQVRDDDHRGLGGGVTSPAWRLSLLHLHRVVGRGCW